MSNAKKQEVVKPIRRRWEKPELVTVGTVGEVLKGGGGKLSLTSSDTGDINKPTGLE
jgi:hypothetical protein